jgi:hypothetical protein
MTEKQIRKALEFATREQLAELGAVYRKRNYRKTQEELGQVLAGRE